MIKKEKSKPLFHRLSWVNRMLATAGSWVLRSQWQLGKENQCQQLNCKSSFSSLRLSLPPTNSHTWKDLDTCCHMDLHPSQCGDRNTDNSLGFANPPRDIKGGTAYRQWAQKKRLTWIWGHIISMQRDHSWVSLYSPEACYAKALTPPKALLSPNGVETKETAKSMCSQW